MALSVGREIMGIRLLKRLGSGGNGEVWRVKTSNGAEVAAKFLLPGIVRNKKRYQRFRDEVHAMQLVSSISRVVPIVSSNLPDTASEDNPPFILMQLAEPCPFEKEHIPDFTAAVEFCLEVALSLEKLHELGLAHRDVKPANIFRYCDQWVLGDFGLASFAGKGKITEKFEKLGPIHYIAPEMLNSADHADGIPADVFSLGKLVWKIFSENVFPIPGIHDSTTSQISKGAHSECPSAFLVDAIIEGCTRFDPRDRLNISQVCREFETLLYICKNQEAHSKVLADLSAPSTQDHRGQPIFARLSHLNSVQNQVASLWLGMIERNFARSVEDSRQRENFFSCEAVVGLRDGNYSDDLGNFAIGRARSLFGNDVEILSACIAKKLPHGFIGNEINGPHLSEIRSAAIFCTPFKFLNVDDRSIEEIGLLLINWREDHYLNRPGFPITIDYEYVERARCGFPSGAVVAKNILNFFAKEMKLYQNMKRGKPYWQYLEGSNGRVHEMSYGT